jgi:hypothetical protein
MSKTLLINAFAVGALALGTAGCHSPSHDHGAATADSGKMACPMCTAGKSGDAVWCAKCGVGYSGGEKVACKRCYESMSAGGGACEMCASKMGK